MLLWVVRLVDLCWGGSLHFQASGRFCKTNNVAQDVFRKTARTNHLGTEGRKKYDYYLGSVKAIRKGSYNPIQYRRVVYGTVHYATVLYSIAHYCTVLSAIVRCCAILYSTVRIWQSGSSRFPKNVRAHMMCDTAARRRVALYSIVHYCTGLANIIVQYGSASGPHNQ